MTEREQAIKIAHKLLDKPWMDPDSDEMVLARQFLRAIERENTYPGTCGNTTSVSPTTGTVTELAQKT